MAALVPTDHIGKITWLGCVTEDCDGVRSARGQEFFASYAGVAGERHGGLTRPSCVRVTRQYPEGTEIRNTRQFSIMSAEELAFIADQIGLDHINPEWMGASMVIEGIPDFTHIPPSARLQAGSGATLVVDMLNEPCHHPGKEIEKDHPGHGKAFKRAAEGRRGITAWVERQGMLTVGDTVRLHIPRQRVWQPEQAADRTAAQ